MSEQTVIVFKPAHIVYAAIEAGLGPMHYIQALVKIEPMLKSIGVEIKMEEVDGGAQGDREVTQLVDAINEYKADQLARAEAAKVPFTCEEVYAIENFDKVEPAIYALRGFYFNHLKGGLDVELSDFDMEALHKDTEIEVRVLKEFFFDPRRFWRLASVWFKGEPVMVIQNAGREGDDHAKRFITNREAFDALCKHLNSFIQRTPWDSASIEADTVDETAHLGMTLTEFYGNELNGHFERH